LSYDLTLFRVPDGADPSLVHERIMDRQESETADLDASLKLPVTDSARAEMRRIAGALKSWRPTLEEFRPESPLPWIELNDENLQIQFEVCEGSVSVTMPYCRDRAEEMMECLAGCFETLDAAAGYSAYDPQLGRVVTAEDLDEMIAQYQEVDQLLPETLTPSPESTAAPTKPWWKLW
jgi:hypothetical protein